MNDEENLDIDLDGGLSATNEQEFDFYWNYRIVNAKSENNGEDWYCLKEVVYYSDKPSSYGNPCTGSEDMESLRDVWRMMGLALEKPPLQEEDFEKDTDE
jgi:hypothetical protein